MPYRYIFKLEYDGSKFDVGWQKQNNGKSSVQESLERASAEITGIRAKFVGAGRTDKGVHALGQIAHADFIKSVPNKVLIDGMNWHLRETGCRVVSATYSKDPNFHARFSAKLKTYRYVICHDRVCSIFDEQRVWWIPSKVILDLNLLQETAQSLLGEYDFSSFRDASCQANSSIRKIEQIDIKYIGNKIEFTFVARSFLHKQIRIMVGTIVDIARYHLKDIHSILNAKNRAMAGQTAPGCGLFLQEVTY